MRTLASSLALFIVLLLTSPPVSARNFRPDQVPNGPTIGCGLCHVSPNGGGTRTSFGEQVLGTLNGQDADWSALFDGDPDLDGYTSGWELGDPDGVWSIGTAHPAFTPSHPGQADSTPCGNDSLEGPELCDGASMNGEDCQSQGFDQGDLVCAADCLGYDTAGCSMAGPDCGDEAIEGDEICDGASLGGETCMSQGFDAGDLACAGDCMAYDTTGCSMAGPDCGDEAIEGDEICDGASLGGETCMSQGFDSGDLACAGDCMAYDTTGCSMAGPDCGDEAIEGDEICDGASLGGETCMSQGFDSGDLACAGDCMAYDTTGCSMAGPDCGDGTIEGDEVCDGDALGGETCESQGFDGGDLACAATCLAFDTTTCIHDKDGGGGCAAAPVTSAGAIWLALLGLWVALGRRRD